MKKHYAIFLFSVLLSFTLNAQPTLTALNSIHSPGDASTNYLADTTGITPGSAGASQTWNFSGLVVGGTSSTVNWVSPSGTPNFADFSTATQSSVDAGNAYSYYQLTGSDYYIIGFADTSIVDVYSDPTKFLTFPFAYNSSIADNCASSYQYMSYTFNMSGNTTTLADGYGTLILPTRSYNALRVKYTVNSVTTSMGFSQTVAQTSYFWFDGVHKDPLMNITNIETTVFSSTTKTKTVSVSSAVAGIPEIKTSTPEQSDIYPNPAGETIYLHYSLDQRTDIGFSIYNLLGEEIVNYPIQSHLPAIYTENFDVHAFAPGLYVLKISKDGTVNQQQFIVQ
jgi:hypothetical protein